MAKKNKIQGLAELRRNKLLKSIYELACELDVRVYLVGGALRDLAFKKNPREFLDWDFAVSLKTLELSKRVSQKLNAAYVILDAQRKIARVIRQKKGQTYKLDFAQFRAKTLEADLKKRDFTINTLCLDLIQFFSHESRKNTLLDYWGAIDDVKDKVVRITHRNNFKNDPLRILRGFTFCAKFKLNFNEETLTKLKKSVSLLKNISGERISEELAKILVHDCSYEQFLKMDKLGVLTVIFPEIKKLKGLDQGLFHHLDGWGHSLESLKQLEKLLNNLDRKFSQRVVKCIQGYLDREITNGRPRIWLLKLACIFHDLGKPQTKFKDLDGKIHFYGHEKKGMQIIGPIAKRLKLSQKETKILKLAVLYHLRAGQIVNRTPSARAKFRFFRDTGEEAVLILLLTLADRFSMQGISSKKKSFVFKEDEIFKMIKFYFKEQKNKKNKTALLNGKELMDLLSLTSGPKIGRILSALHEAQALKEINTKAQAKHLAKKIKEDLSL